MKATHKQTDLSVWHIWQLHAESSNLLPLASEMFQSSCWGSQSDSFRFFQPKLGATQSLNPSPEVWLTHFPRERRVNAPTVSTYCDHWAAPLKHTGLIAIVKDILAKAALFSYSVCLWLDKITEDNSQNSWADTGKTEDGAKRVMWLCLNEGQRIGV